MYNTKVIELEKKIIAEINSSCLHLATVDLILNKISTMIDNALQEELNKEQSIEKTND